MIQVAVVVLIGAVTLGSLLLRKRKPVSPDWYRNPAYNDLGAVSEEWLCSQKRNPER